MDAPSTILRINGVDTFADKNSPSIVCARHGVHATECGLLTMDKTMSGSTGSGVVSPALLLCMGLGIRGRRVGGSASVAVGAAAGATAGWGPKRRGCRPANRGMIRLVCVLRGGRNNSASSSLDSELILNAEIEDRGKARSLPAQEYGRENSSQLSC